MASEKDNGRVMARPRKKPEYDPEVVMKELLSTISECYISSGGNGAATSLRSVAEEFGFTHLKARKLLITADVYGTELSDEVQYLKSTGKTIPEIMKITGLSRASVHSYLPYTKIAYNVDELSLNAERIRKFRARQEAVRLIQSCIEDNVRDLEKYVWKAMIPFADYPFRTERGKKYKYAVVGWKIRLDWKDIIIQKSTINEAVVNVMEQKGSIKAPEQLNVPDAEFLYPIFKRLTLI